VAQYRATIEGNRGIASRLGTKSSGIECSVNGWDIGVSITISHHLNKDVVNVALTGGSNGSYVKSLGVYEIVNGMPQRIQNNEGG